jgi:glyoxylase-like metal-dependent hydrolase (beta-lactamase superfamily II)
MSTPFPVSVGQTIAQFEIGPLRNFIYLVIDWKTQSAWVVDPQADLGPLLNAFETHCLKLEGILLTHSHHDHVAGLPALVKMFPGIQIYVGKRDAHRIKAEFIANAQITLLSEEKNLALGSLSVRTIPTPGHSAGEICYFLDQTHEQPPYLLTGDTVFIRDCGRTDFPDSSNEEMFASLQRIRKLPANTVILPGHHYQPEYTSTLERELLESPPFQCRSVNELASLP